MSKLVMNVTNGKNDTDRATVGFVLANASIASGQETVVFLSIDGAYLASEGYADEIHEEGFAPLKELMDSFAKAGGSIWVCSPCFKKRNLDEQSLVAGSTIVGGAKLMEFLAQDAAALTF